MNVDELYYTEDEWILATDFIESLSWQRTADYDSIDIEIRQNKMKEAILL